MALMQLLAPNIQIPSDEVSEYIKIHINNDEHVIRNSNCILNISDCNIVKFDSNTLFNLDQIEKKNGAVIIKIPYKKVCEYVYLHVDNNLIKINNRCDIINLKYFCFTDNRLNINEFKDIIRNRSCILNIGNCNIVTFDFNILIELNQIEKKNDTFMIKIPDYIINEIIVIMIQHHTINLIFNFTHDFQSIDIITKYNYYDTNIRRIYAQCIHEHIIQNIYHTVNITGEQLINEIILECDLLTKGFFVKGNLNNIKKIELRLNGLVRFNYNDVMLSYLGHVVSENMFYISFEGSNNYKDLTFDSYVESLNLLRINDVNLKLDLYEQNVSTYDIYFISMNILKYVSGMANVLYESPNINIIYQT